MYNGVFLLPLSRERERSLEVLYIVGVGGSIVSTICKSVEHKYVCVRTYIPLSLERGRESVCYIPYVR